MSKPFPHIIPSIKDWPIYKHARAKKEFKEALKENAFQILLAKNEGKLKELLAQCAYSEKNRVQRKPWRVDPASEKSFWMNMSKELTQGKDCEDEENCKVLLKKIISRYVEEIVGDFKMETYLFADKFLMYFFNRLFSSWFAGSILNLFGKRKLLYRKMHVKGYVEETRELFKKGTVVLVPTHQSNIDSILLGYYMHLIVGIPAFSYGAGLNLYNFEILARYMNRLGAYKVDRRKKNAVYHETLFTFLKLSVQDKVNNLFFPAGGRVRDGKIEQKLKMGLLSALIQAQKSNCKQANNEKIFVVPVILNYHFVLEAKPMINAYLSQRGKERFSRHKKSKGSNYLSIIPYIMGLVSGKSEAVLSFGQPMDVLGNPVNSEGVSLDNKGEEIGVENYFMIDGVFSPDFQRESIYTKKLAESIAASYKDHAVVLSSQLVAFAVYQYFKNRFGAQEVFEMLGQDKDDLEFRDQDLLAIIEKFQVVLTEKEKEGTIILDEEIGLPGEELLRTGIKKLGVFHLKRPLKYYSDGRIVCKDLKLLYYYANRLSGFGFEQLLFD